MNQDNQSSSEISVGQSWTAGRQLANAVRSNQVANDVWDDCVARFMGINRTDTRCMDIVESHGKVTAGVLAEKSGLTTGAVTVLVDRLEAIGYLARTRDTNDRRKVWIEITPMGRDMSGRLFSHFRHLGPVVAKRYSADQLAAIIDFLEMGSAINLDQAELLEQHVDRKGTTPEARLVAARIFERSADKRMQAMIETLHKGAPSSDPT